MQILKSTLNNYYETDIEYLVMLLYELFNKLIADDGNREESFPTNCLWKRVPEKGKEKTKASWFVFVFVCVL